MTTVFDRRRANGPEGAVEPVYNVKVASLSGGDGIWAVDENCIVHNPKAAPKDLLQVESTPLGHNDLSVDRLALSQPVPRSNGRGERDPRPLCTPRY